MPQNSQYYQQRAPRQTTGRTRRPDNRLAIGGLGPIISRQPSQEVAEPQYAPSPSLPVIYRPQQPSYNMPPFATYDQPVFSGPQMNAAKMQELSIFGGNSRQELLQRGAHPGEVSLMERQALRRRGVPQARPQFSAQQLVEMGADPYEVSLMFRQPPASQAPQASALEQATARAQSALSDMYRQRSQQTYYSPNMYRDMSQPVEGEAMAQFRHADYNRSSMPLGMDNRYAHILGGQQQSPAAQAGVGLTGTRAIRREVQPGKLMQSGTVMAPNGRGGMMGVNPAFAERYGQIPPAFDPNTGHGSGDFRFQDAAGHIITPEQMREEYINDTLLRSPNSDEGRAIRAAERGGAYRGMGSERARAISEFARGVGEEPQNLTPLEQRRIETIQNRGVRLPGYATPMSREQADSILEDAPRRRRAARGIPENMGKADGSGAGGGKKDKGNLTFSPPIDPETQQLAGVDTEYFDNWLSTKMSGDDAMTPEQFAESLGTENNPYTRDHMLAKLADIDEKLTGPASEAWWDMRRSLSNRAEQEFQQMVNHRQYIAAALGGASPPQPNYDAQGANDYFWNMAPAAWLPGIGPTVSAFSTWWGNDSRQPSRTGQAQPQQSGGIVGAADAKSSRGRQQKRKLLQSGPTTKWLR